MHLSTGSVGAYEDRLQPESTLPLLEKAILQTVAYADVFDYPLTDREVHRYLIGLQSPQSVVQRALNDGGVTYHRLGHSRGYWTLAGRESIVETRLRREAVSARLWRKAMRYGLAIASLPFVRLVAITGTLAMNNVDHGADVDYLIVTTPRRVWLARSLCLVFVRLGRLEGVTICPNYVISTDALEQFDRSLFTAHEIAQMIPIYGSDVYRQLLDANTWAQHFLPNAFDPGRELPPRRVWPISQVLKRGAESALWGRLGDMWESKESSVKIHRLRKQAESSEAGAAAFTPQRCKGHLDNHGHQISRAYIQRLRQVGLDAENALQ